MFQGITNALGRMSDSRSNHKLRMADLDRQQVLDQHNIRLQLAQEDRAREQHKNAVERHETDLTTTGRQRAGQVAGRYFDPETNSIDRNRVREFLTEYSSVMSSDPALRRVSSSLVSTRTNGKYDSFNFRELDDGRFVIEMSNSDTGQRGVVTDNASEDPDDPVTILTGEEAAEFAMYLGEFSGAKVSPHVMGVFVNNMGAEGTANLRNSGPQIAVQAIEQAEMKYPEAAPEEIVALADDIVASGRFIGVLPYEEQEKNLVGQIELDPLEATNRSGTGISVSGMSTSGEGTPATQGARNRRLRFDEEMGIPAAEVKPSQNTGPLPETSPPREPRSFAEWYGSRLRKTGDRWVSPVVEGGKYLSQGAEWLFNRSAEAVSDFGKGFTNPEGVPKGEGTLPPGQKPAKGRQPTNVARPSTEQAGSREGVQQFIKENAQAIANGERALTVSQERQAVNAVKNNSQDRRARGLSALYMFHNNLMSLDQATLYAETGFTNTSMAAFSMRRDEAKREEMAKVQEALRESQRKLIEGSTRIYEHITKRSEGMLKELDIDSERFPEISRIFMRVLGASSSIKLGSLNPDELLAGGYDERFLAEVENYMKNPVFESAFKSAVSRANSLMQDKKFRRKNPDMETLVVGLTIAEFRGLGPSRISDEKEQASYVDLMYNLAREYGGRAAEAQTLNGISAVINGFMSVHGKPPSEIMPEDLFEYLDLWDDLLRESGGDIEASAKAMTRYMIDGQTE